MVRRYGRGWERGGTLHVRLCAGLMRTWRVVPCTRYASSCPAAANTSLSAMPVCTPHLLARLTSPRLVGCGFGIWVLVYCAVPLTTHTHTYTHLATLLCTILATPPHTRTSNSPPGTGRRCAPRPRGATSCAPTWPRGGRARWRAATACPALASCWTARSRRSRSRRCGTTRRNSSR